MKKSKGVGFAAMGLVVGLVVGSIGIAGATTLSKTTSSTATAGAAAAMRGPGGPGGPHGPGGRGGFGGLGDIPEAIENLTDLSVDQVMTKREAGTSFAAIAKAEGVSESALIAETVKIEKAELAAAVKAGTLTAAEQTQILKDIESNLKTAVESTDAMRGPGGHAGSRRPRRLRWPG